MEAMPGQPAQHLQCPLYRPDSSSFAASLRELEKVTGMWVGGSSPKGRALGLSSAFGSNRPFYRLHRVVWVGKGLKII